MTAILVRNLADLAVSVAVLGVATAILHGVERLASRAVARRLGWNAVLVTGWIGVPLHELSHLLLARVFRHRVVAFELFEPDPATGTLGYVWHAYRRRNLWQLVGGFFIGVAPLAGGALALGVLMAWMTSAVPVDNLFPEHVALPFDHAWWRSADAWSLLSGRVLAAAVTWLSAVWQMRTLWLPLQLYLAIAVACHMAPSGRDLQSAFPGLLLLTTLVTLSVVGLSLAGRSLSVAAVVAPLALIVVVVVTSFQALYVVTVAVLHAATSRPRAVSVSR